MYPGPKPQVPAVALAPSEELPISFSYLEEFMPGLASFDVDVDSSGTVVPRAAALVRGASAHARYAVKGGVATIDEQKNAVDRQFIVLAMSLPAVITVNPATGLEVIPLDVLPAGTRDDWDLSSLSWTATATDVAGPNGLVASRISTSPASGNWAMPSTQVHVVTTGLAPGSYTGRIHVTGDIGLPGARTSS